MYIFLNILIILKSNKNINSANFFKNNNLKKICFLFSDTISMKIFVKKSKIVTRRAAFALIFLFWKSRKVTLPF